MIRYIVSEEEAKVLEQFAGLESFEKNEFRAWEKLSREALITVCRLKNRTSDIFARRYEASKEVINQLAELVGIDPDNCSHWLYTPSLDGSSVICEKVKEYISKSGDKAVLKKRVDELERENTLLKKLVRGE